ncbi:hypothetical protein [Nitrosospira briensis]|uniref:hypothetical protein n=1 Tax=Nitrosospira briensis TaxID=35799 RepID=UPI0008F04ACC|nr:hypothetical protein [Nitrosospira briensis]SFO42543.1 hypothetical protein SAMN05216332_11619 [Nitrosospira briensis]
MAKKAKVNTPAPTVHIAKANPAVTPATKDPCRHRKEASTKDGKKVTFVVYRAKEMINGKWTGNWYIGRTRGTGTVTQILDRRKANHHRPDIGDLEMICTQDSYSACRGAEQKHYDALKNSVPPKVITTPRKKGKGGAQIAPIRDDHDNRDDYMNCAKNEKVANTTNPCSTCSA